MILFLLLLLAQLAVCNAQVCSFVRLLQLQLRLRRAFLILKCDVREPDLHSVVAAASTYFRCNAMGQLGEQCWSNVSTRVVVNGVWVEKELCQSIIAVIIYLRLHYSSGRDLVPERRACCWFLHLPGQWVQPVPCEGARSVAMAERQD